MARFESEGGYDLGYGSRAHLACEPGYVEVEGGEEGGGQLICSEDGTWQGRVIPCFKVNLLQVN
jgi:hypothetical protein